jgi:hypothetical protein
LESVSHLGGLLALNLIQETGVANF